MFERFTPRARDAVVGAQQVARDLGHREIGDDHLLLALLEGEGVAARVLRDAGADPARLREHVAHHRGPDEDAAALRSLGIDLDAVRSRAEETFGPGALDRPTRRRRGLLGRLTGSGPSSGHVPFTRPAKKALEESLKAALSLRHNYIGTEHLLLGLLRQDGSAARALAATGVDLDAERARDAVVEALRRSA
ncbi:Clp protease N-terminal domain-containing protein [Kineococcus auxinigenes]|uniref:Clp protease N-terminal domain-containing protein n=1 Tax=unclassified Kineococcus TaxID=2621656 RepID=UPI003D7C5306